MKLCCFKLYRTYSILFSSSKCWQFFLELNYKRLYGVQQKKNKVVVLCSHSYPANRVLSRKIQGDSVRKVSHSAQNMKLGILCCSRAVTAKKCTKKHDARAELLFCQSKPITFLPFSLMSPSLLAKLLIISHN